MVQMLADSGRKDDALRVLDDLEKLKQNFDVAKIHYSRGNLLFWYREYDAALASLSKVTGRANQVEGNTGLNAWLRTGQCFDMKGQRAKALEAYRQAVNAAPDSDAGKEAKRYLSSPFKR